MTRRAAKRRPMLNEEVYTDPRDPNGWGPADALPSGKKREEKLPIWEQMLRDHGAGNDKGNRAWFTPEMQSAGNEIYIIYSAITAGLMPKSHMGDHTSGGGGSATDWADWMIIAKNDRYLPWSRAMDAHAWQIGEPVHGILIDLAVEDIPLSEAFQRNHVGFRRGLKLVEYGLGMYVTMAGWGRRKK